MGQWEAFGGSVRGAVHVRGGAKNEDAFLAAETTPLICRIAVADGHGDRRACRSHIGSHLAVSAASEVIEGSGDLAALAVDGAARMVDRWRGAVHAHLEAHPFTDVEIEIVRETSDGLGVHAAYGSTLIAAATDGTRLVGWQIGDGDFIVVDRSGRARHGIPPEPTVLSTATMSLCLPSAAASARGCDIDVDATGIVAVLLSTDGFGDAFVDDDWYTSVTGHVMECVRSRSYQQLVELVPSWLAEPAAVYGDDATLAIMTTEVAKDAASEAGVAVSEDTSPRIDHRWMWVALASSALIYILVVLLAR